jgi:hypothetical protein
MTREQERGADAADQASGLENQANDQRTSQWLVLWVRGGRIGSVPLTPENKTTLQAEFCMSLMQIDITGTEHWHVLSPWGRNQRTRRERSEEIEHLQAVPVRH